MTIRHLLVFTAVLLSCARAPTADPVTLARLDKDVLNATALAPSTIEPLLVEAEKLRALAVPEAHVGSAAVAVLQLAKGDPVAAELAAREAVARNAAVPVNQLVLARAFLARKSFDPAIDAYREVLKLDPKQAAATDELGRVLFERGRFKDALPYLEAVANTSAPVKTGAAAWRRVGLARTAAADPSGAAEALQKALALDPDDKESHLALAELFLLTNRADLALAEFTRSSELGAEPAATCGLARAIDRIGDPAKAAPLYEGCANSEPTRFDVWVNAAQAWEKAGNKPKALARYQQYVEIASRDPSRKKEVEEALANVNRLAGTPPPAP